MSEVGDFTSV